jgi:limonene-1,2-epoxide hydrolase
MVAATPPSPPAIVRAWSKALNANDNKAAAALFAPGARLVQGVDVRLSPRLALAWNRSLPCGGTIVGLTRNGDRVRATFLLKERPKHTCDGPGEKAAAVFVVKKGKIVYWEQVPVQQTGVGA